MTIQIYNNISSLRSSYVCIAMLFSMYLTSLGGLAGGVTIITHGWDLVSGQKSPKWLESMRKAVLTRSGIAEENIYAKIIVTGDDDESVPPEVIWSSWNISSSNDVGEIPSGFIGYKAT